MSDLRKRLFFFVVLAWCLPFAAAMADSLVSDCRSEVEGDEETFVCQLRTTSGKSLNNITVEQDDGTDLEFTSKSYNWASDKTAIYFLVQTAGVSKNQLERFSTYLSRAAYPVGKQAMGIATAGTSFQQAANLGAYRPKLESTARNLERMAPVDGETVVLRSLPDAISKLANYNADRKAIFVLSDPAPATSGLDEANVINQARNVNVAIYFIVEGKSGTEPSRQLTNIARKTNGGIYVLTDLSKSALLTAASRAPERIENGVILGIDATNLADNSQLKISARVPGEGTLSTPLINLERQTETTWLSPKKLIGDNLYALIAALVLTSGLALLLMSYTSNTRGAPPATAGPSQTDANANDDETRILSQNWAAGQEASAVAWLDLIGSGNKPLPIAPGSIRIGRSRDNDVQLTNQSVHRHHAILQVSDDGSVSIQDLGTKNGVFVNQSRCNECALCVDDVIELGEVKLRLTTKPS